MYNDDVTAVCPECGSADVTYTSQKIACLTCESEDSFGYDFAQPSPATDALDRAKALDILQRWSFAG